MDKYNYLKERLDLLPQLVKIAMGDYVPQQGNLKLKKAEFETLMEIQYAESKPMNYYCEKMNLENGSFTYIVDKLEKSGLVKRVSHEKDRRKKMLILTDEGRKIGSAMREEVKEHLLTKLSLLENEEKVKLSQALDMLQEILNSLEKKLANNFNNNEITLD